VRRRTTLGRGRHDATDAWSGQALAAVARQVERMVRHRCRAVANRYLRTTLLDMIQASGALKLQTGSVVASEWVEPHSRPVARSDMRVRLACCDLALVAARGFY
jgi:hypothetical protein